MQRLLWASTGVKDTTFPATRYVTELVARDTVNTMPEATPTAVGALDGATPDTITGGYAAARDVVAGLAALGIDLADVSDKLERDGIAAFEQSWTELIASVEQQVEQAGAEVMPAGAVKPARGSVPIPMPRLRALRNRPQSANSGGPTGPLPL